MPSERQAIHGRPIMNLHTIAFATRFYAHVVFLCGCFCSLSLDSPIGSWLLFHDVTQTTATRRTYVSMSYTTTTLI
jgi:hypothetical protein